MRNLFIYFLVSVGLRDVRARVLVELILHLIARERVSMGGG